MNSRALTKVQSVVLVAIIVVAAVGGSAAYILWRDSQPPLEDMKIGICADLDNTLGKQVWQAAVLAAEQVNAEGGVLGRNFTIVAEDDDDETLPGDIVVAANAMTKLIAFDKADFVISNAIGTSILLPHQDIASQHKKILFGVRGADNAYTQRVLDDYDKYKYFFKFGGFNSTSVAKGMVGDILTLANYTGFTKIALLGQEANTTKQLFAGLNSSLPKYGFEIVYSGLVPAAVTDFTSYFAAVEASGAQVLVPAIVTQASVSFIKEWHDRQSPCVVFGVMSYAGDPGFWDLTEGKCEFVSTNALPVAFGYPLTNKTVHTREAYFERWGKYPTYSGTAAVYDGIRFILPDAIKRAGTIETDALINALEATNVETSLARHFVFTGSHDIMMGTGEPNSLAEDFMVMCIFQWQANRTVVPVRPTALMLEAGATYQYPPWEGSWSR